jgi:DNA polymerase-3 subunit delta
LTIHAKSAGKYIPPRLKSDIRNNQLPEVILLYGKEQLLADQTVDYIKTSCLDPAFADVDFVRLDGNTIRMDEFNEYLETLPLGDKKIICLYNAPHFSGDGKLKRDGPKISYDEMLKQISNVPAYVKLILNTGKVDKRKTLYKTVQAKGAYEFAGLDRPGLFEFIEDGFYSGGKKVTSQAISTLINLTGYLEKDSEYSLVLIVNDIGKIIAYSTGDTISHEDVSDIVGATINTIVFALSDAVSRGKTGEAIKILHDLLSTGSKVFMLLGLIFSQFDSILKIRDLLDRGLSRQDIQKSLGIDSFRFKILLDHAMRFTLRQLKQIIRSAYEVDKNIKTGLLTDELALEMFIYEAGSAHE